MRRSWVGLTALIAVTTLATAAAADAYDAMLSRAIAAKERALDNNDPASWEDALALFQQADRIRSTKETKYELGSAAARLRQDDLAIEAYESALALGIEGGPREKAQAFIAEKSGQMARLVVVGPEGAEVWVGPRRRGKLPLGRPLVVFAGPSHVRLVHGGREQERDLSIVAGNEERIDFTPSVAPPAPPTPPSERADPTPPVTQPPAVDPVPDENRRLAWTLLIAGSATALVGGGFVIGASATIDSRRERLAELCAVPSGEDACAAAEPGQRAAAQSEVDAIATWKAARVGGWIGLGVGAAAAGTGLVLLLGGKESPRNAHLLLLPTPGGAAFSVTGAM